MLNETEKNQIIEGYKKLFKELELLKSKYRKLEELSSDPAVIQYLQLLEEIKNMESAQSNLQKLIYDVKNQTITEFNPNTENTQKKR